MTKKIVKKELTKGFKMSKICEHLDWDNQHDCQNEAEYICACCGAVVCPEHRTRVCDYGGGGFVEL